MLVRSLPNLLIGTTMLASWLPFGMAQTTAPGLPGADISFSGAEIQLMALLLMPIIGGITGMFWLVMRAKDAQIHQMEGTKDAQIQQALNITLTLIAAKDQTISAKDQTIGQLDRRCDVLDGRLIETGKMLQETALATRDATNANTNALGDLADQIRQARKEDTEQHKQQIALLQALLPERPPKPRPVPKGA